MDRWFTYQLYKRVIPHRATIYQQHSNLFYPRNNAKKKDKLYIKGYKVYGADNTERRKGVAILVSNELNSINQVLDRDEANGRYIQLKITAENDSSKKIIFNKIHVEPDQEENKGIILENIWQSEHIAGDMNKMKTGYTIESNVYHLKNMGKKKDKIIIPKNISDHPILIYQMSIPIPFKEEHEQITIYDKNIISQNKDGIYKITQNINYTPNFIKPIKIITRKIHDIKLNNENFTQNFIELKEKEKFKQIKQKKADEISKLIETKQLGTEPYQRLTSLMQLWNPHIWFKPESNKQKDKVIKGFIELYNHKRIKNCTKESIANILLLQLEALIKKPESINLDCPRKPKSSARDKNGMNQGELWESIYDKNIHQAALKLAIIIQNSSRSQTGDILLHRTSKKKKKKKKDTIETWKDGRAMSIMPAIFMIDHLQANKCLRKNKAKKPYIQPSTWRKGRNEHFNS